MSAPQSAPATGIKILIAEDHADQRKILGVSLAHAGFLPIALRSGEGVVDRVRAERPALILLDIAMPGLDGYSVCRLLKADPELSAIPVILMTTGATVTAPVVDRGPFVSGRDWDLTRGACAAIDHCFTGSIDWNLAAR